MKNLYFLKDTFFNKEVAFILNVPFRVIEKKDALKYNNKRYFVDNEIDEKYLKKRKIKCVTVLDVYKFLDKYNRKEETVDREEFYTDIDDINKVPIEQLSLSEMFIKVLYSRPKNIDCKLLEFYAYINDEGVLGGCCPSWVGKTYGNILEDKNVYNNYYSRMIILSAYNKTYCFCNLNMCHYFDRRYINKIDQDIKLAIIDCPKELNIAVDRTCNLHCRSCRDRFFLAEDWYKERTHAIVDRLLELGWPNKTKMLLAGQGEVFVSKEYLRLLINDMDEKRESINIFSNGILLNEEKWKLLEDNYKEINVSISVDAASEKVYKIIRNADFKIVLKNLKMLSKYRKNGKLNFFQLNYVIQRDNMNDIIKFVKLAKKLHVDNINFTKLGDWFSMPYEEYCYKTLILGDYLEYDLYKILKNPILKDEIVTIDDFIPYMEKSEEIYKNKN